MSTIWKTELLSEVTYKAVRSQGPGGQNVNKVSSAAVLLWSPANSELFTAVEQERLLKVLSVDKTGHVRIKSQKFRDLAANKRAALERLTSKIEAALEPVKIRRPTRPTRSSKLKTVKNKKIRAEVKKLRAKVRP